MRAARQHDDKDTLTTVPWFWRDWRASRARAFFISTRNWLGLACYRELLDAHWGEEDCALPGEDVELAALAGVGIEDWLSVRDVVLRWLNETEDGRRRNPRAFREWKKATKGRAVARKRARTAAKALWDKKKAEVEARRLEHARSIAQAIHKDSPSTTTTSSSTSTSTSPTGETGKATTTQLGNGRDDDEPGDGNGGTTLNLTDDERNAYGKAVWAAFVARRGPGPREPSAKETALISGWIDDGIPLRVVLRGIKDTGGQPRTLMACEKPVREERERVSRHLG